ncbi:MAG: diadenylate cyclase CdaA [bacterium]|nr:diadenylate cyclase CdaA [bacterium]
MQLAIFGSITTEAGNRIDSFFQALDFGPMAVIDVIVVGGILYWLYLVLRETRAIGIIYGILIIVLAFITARLLGLDLLAFLFANLLTLLFVAIPILFQPELRRALERLGRVRYGHLKRFGAERSETLDKVVEATRILSQSRTGAIIVFKRRTGLSDSVTSGITVDAEVSTPLLLNLFFHRSPLHDGAVVIDGDRIAAAGVMLPLSERDYGYTLGARHRAAAGLTEQSDAVVLVVSEEQGIISLSVGGKITPGIEPDDLRRVLAEFLVRRPSANRRSGGSAVSNEDKAVGNAVRRKAADRSKNRRGAKRPARKRGR